MNWKDVLGQIAQSGKFGAMVGINYDLECDIIGYRADDNKLLVKGINSTVDAWLEIGFCKFIARPISDMSDEEINFLYQDQNNFSMKQRRALLKNRVEHDALYFTDVLYLLSMGVYPFEDETGVIFKNKESAWIGKTY